MADMNVISITSGAVLQACTSNKEFADWLRGVADIVEKGGYGELDGMVMFLSDPGRNIAVRCQGDLTRGNAYFIGLAEMGKMQMWEDIGESETSDVRK